MDRLLILSCSQRKVSMPGCIPAIDRYDGPAFRVLRKYLREGASFAPTVLIVSAKYGLIESSRRIAEYDCRMTATQALELQPRILATARRVLSEHNWQEIAICAGKHYRNALDGLLSLLTDSSRIVFIGGGQGVRLARLRAWLRMGGAKPC